MYNISFLLFISSNSFFLFSFSISFSLSFVLNLTHYIFHFFLTLLFLFSYPSVLSFLLHVLLGANFDDLRNARLLTHQGVFRNIHLIGPKLTSNIFSSLAKTIQNENIREIDNNLLPKNFFTETKFNRKIEEILQVIGNDDIRTILPLLSHKWIYRMRNGELIETVIGITEMTVFQTSKTVKNSAKNIKTNNFNENLLSIFENDLKIDKGYTDDNINDNNINDDDNNYDSDINEKQTLSSIIIEFEFIKNSNKHENNYTDITDIESSTISNRPFSVLTHTINSLSTSQLFTLLENFEYFGINKEIFLNVKHGNIANLVETKIVNSLLESVNAFEKYLLQEISEINKLNEKKNEIKIENFNFNLFSSQKKEEIIKKSLNFIKSSTRLINNISNLFGSWYSISEKNKNKFYFFMKSYVTLFSIQNFENILNSKSFLLNEFSPSISEEINNEKIIIFKSGNRDQSNKEIENKEIYNDNYEKNIETKIDFIFALGKFRFPLFSEEKTVNFRGGMPNIEIKKSLLFSV